MSELEPSYDPETLREVYSDPRQVRARVDELRAEIREAPDEVAELLARGELVDLLRAVGDLDEAGAEAERAVDRSVLAGTAAQQHLARVRRAQVLQWRGEFAESNLAFTELVHAAGQFGPVVAAFTHEQAGKNSYDQGDFAAARDQFGRALALRQEFELPEDQIASARTALAAARRHAGEDTR